MMKALVLEDYNRLEYTDYPVPQFGSDEVLVRVKAAGICGSDIHGMDGSSGRRIPQVIMGHEASGVIEKVGDAVTRYKTGDRVTFDSTIYCGACHYCRQGRINLCENRKVLGVSCDDYRQQGAFAEFVAVPERILYKLPELISFEQAAMIEPCSIAFHAVNITPISVGDSAVVFGTGMVGLFVVQALRIAECGQIVAVDIDENKLDLARDFGADKTFNANEVNVPKEIQNLTNGRGANHTFEVVGRGETVSAAIRSVRKGGSVTLVGNLAAEVDLPLQSVVTREVTLYGSCASSGEYPACIEMISRGAVYVDKLISMVVPLSNGPEWFQRLYDGEENLMKVILKP